MSLPLKAFLSADAQEQSVYLQRVAAGQMTLAGGAGAQDKEVAAYVAALTALSSGMRSASTPRSRFTLLMGVVTALRPLFIEVDAAYGAVLRAALALARRAAIACQHAHDDEPCTELQNEIKTKLLGMCLRDQVAGHGTLGLCTTVELLRLYFAMRKVSLCAVPLKSFRELQGQNVANFSKAERVTYHYYGGRFALVDGQFDEAFKQLKEAWSLCRNNAFKQKRAILVYLVPLMQLKGRCPPDALLERYGLKPFVPLSNAVRLGDMRVLQEAKQRYVTFYIQTGIFLLLERLRLVVFRSLLRRVTAIHQQMTPERAHVLPLSSLDAAARLTGVCDEADETECLLTNLIAAKTVRAYIHHEHQVVIFARQGELFPSKSLW